MYMSAAGVDGELGNCDECSGTEEVKERIKRNVGSHRIGVCCRNRRQLYGKVLHE